jgi:small subunit ribosomal protein S17
MAQVARKAREGTVVSDKMDKTVVVAVSSSTRHRLYKKIMRRLRRYMVHDETNDAKLGDRVRIVESRPHSRRKRWQLAEVLVRADRPEVAAEEIDLELLGEVKVEEEEQPEAAEEPEAEEQLEPEAKEAPEEPAEAAEEPEAEEQPEPEAKAEPEEPAEAEEAPEEEPPEVAEEPEAEEQPEPEAKEAPEAEGEEEEES